MSIDNPCGGGEPDRGPRREFSSVNNKTAFDGRFAAHGKRPQPRRARTGRADKAKTSMHASTGNAAARR